MLSKLKAILRRKRPFFRRDPNRFLRRVHGVIHVGANTGQERHLYEKHGLRVLWIEPIPEIFEKLKANLAAFPPQRALQGLVTDQDGADYSFHVSNNDGLSSSLLDFNQHKDIWPDVTFEKTITLRSHTLSSLLEQERIDPADYDALVMDTQGSELLVLQGAAPLLKHFTYIKTEVPDFEAYAGCCRVADIAQFLERHGFKELSRFPFALHPHGGRYYDVVYQRQL